MQLILTLHDMAKAIRPIQSSSIRAVVLGFRNKLKWSAHVSMTAAKTNKPLGTIQHTFGIVQRM